MPTSVDQTVREAARQFAGAGIESGLLDSRLLMAHVLGLDAAGLISKGRDTLSAKDRSEFDALIERRLAREPVALILGFKEFWGLSFEVSPETLIPRPDSETLIEAAMQYAGDRAQSTPLRILDLGTGTGCLLLSLLHEWPTATGVGGDINQRAIVLAERNARRLGLHDRAAFVESDWTSNVEGTFDLVIANPPYIPEAEIESLMADVSQYEPELALSGGRDGVDAYRALEKLLPKVLNSEGLLILEIGRDQAQIVRNLMFSGGEMRFLAVKADLAGNQRCVVGQKVN